MKTSTVVFTGMLLGALSTAFYQQPAEAAEAVCGKNGSPVCAEAEKCINLGFWKHCWEDIVYYTALGGGGGGGF